MQTIQAGPDLTVCVFQMFLSFKLSSLLCNTGTYLKEHAANVMTGRKMCSTKRQVFVTTVAKWSWGNAGFL